MRAGSKSLKLMIAATLAAAYTGLVLALPGLSFLGLNIRVADGLRGLIPFLGWPAVKGLVLGHFIANLQSPLGVLDLISVPVAAAGMSIAKILSRRLLVIAFVPLWLMLTAWLAWLLSYFLMIDYAIMFVVLLPQIFISDYLMPTMVAYTFKRLLPNIISRIGRPT
jgi:QueT transporter.